MVDMMPVVTDQNVSVGNNSSFDESWEDMSANSLKIAADAAGTGLINEPLTTRSGLMIPPASDP